MEYMWGFLEMIALRFLYKEKLERAELERQLIDFKKRPKVIRGSNVSDFQATDAKTKQKSRIHG